MNEVLYPVAIAIVISAVFGFLTTALKKLKSIKLHVDFSEENSSEQNAVNPPRNLPENHNEKFLP